LDEFQDTAKIFLKDARKEFKDKRYASCVIHAHLVIEHALKALISKKLTSVKFRAIPDLTHEALKQDLVKEALSKQILIINSLRNKVYHEGYIPRAHEAENALQIAGNVFKILSPK
jgi:HEPN domain-containing protein